MVWLILSGLLILLAIIIFFKTIDVIPTLFTFIIAMVIILAWSLSYMGWQQEAEELRIAFVSINNKIVTIQNMRKTYYEPPQSIQFNMDMANKDLASDINKAILDLEKHVSSINKTIVRFKVSYRYRFWGACFVKPPITEPILLSDFNL